MRTKFHVVIIVATSAASLAGCVLGPDFRRPPPPPADRYTVQPLPGRTDSSAGPDGGVQIFAGGGKIPGKWWTLYGSTALDELVDEALKANPSVQSAQAALRQAHENVLAAWGVLAPAIDAAADGTRQRITGAQFGPTGEPAIYNLYNASINVSYGIDFFGRARRELESLRAQREYQRFALDATYLTLAANVVTTAITEGSLREQILATEQLIEASGKRLELIERQQTLGGASLADVLAQRSQLAQDRAALPGLRSQLDQQRALLATLLGRVPSDQPGAVFELNSLQLPAEIPILLPSQLVAQRPDVRQQEELLHEASAQVGVATANMLPQLTLSGSFGGSSSNFDKLLQASNRVWSVSAGATQPIFHGGQLLHQRRAAVAAYDEAAAVYRETVLTAFRNVADSLRAVSADAEQLKEVREAHEAAAASLAITDRQYALGGASYLSLLTAQRTERQTRISMIQAQAARLTDTAALFQALGGGWWSHDAQPAAARVQQ